MRLPRRRSQSDQAMQVKAMEEDGGQTWWQQQADIFLKKEFIYFIFQYFI
jgi:hypothetical protein